MSIRPADSSSRPVSITGGAQPTPAGPTLAPAAAPPPSVDRGAPPTGLPEVAIRTGVDGAFQIAGAGLKAPKHDLWDHILDTLIEIFTLGFAETRTYNEGIDEGYWRAAALSLAFARAAQGPNARSLFGPGFTLGLVEAKLRAAIESSSKDVDHVHIDKIMEQMRADLDRLDGEWLPSDLLALNRFAADRSFPRRGDLVELLQTSDWTALEPLMESPAFRNAGPAEQARMLGALVESLDTNFIAHRWPSVDSFRLAVRREPDPYSVAAPVDVGDHSFHDDGVEAARRIDIQFPEGVVPIFVQADGDYRGGHMHSVETIADALALLPPILRRQIVELNLSGGDYAYASADGRGILTLYAVPSGLVRFGHKVGEALDVFVEPTLAAVLAHEVGHVITMNVSDDIPWSEVEERWKNAVARDLTRTTPYGATEISEEMAEVFKVYALAIGTPFEDKYREKWGARFEVLDWLMAHLEQRPGLGDDDPPRT